MDAAGCTFKSNFTGEGTARLRDTVKEKLKEFMGDYTDDTLVEYVIVLLRNGRQKEQARKELDVFLGDDSESFVSWLWNHLSSHSHLYTQPTGDVAIKVTGKHALMQGIANNVSQSLDDQAKEKSIRFRTRHNRDWKDLAHDDHKPPILQSPIDDNGRFSDRHHSPVGASSSPRSQIQRKRIRQDEESTVKREPATRLKLDAPRRLLQFAVRDAVRTAQKAPSRLEPSLKRLRSIISTSAVDVCLEEQPRKIRSVSIGAAASAIKAAAEAAEDVKGRSSRNVFDRLSHGSGGSFVHMKSRTAVEDNGDKGDFDRYSRPGGYQQRSEHKKVGGDTRNVKVMEESPDFASASCSENEDFELMSSLSGANDTSRSAETSLSQKDKDVTMTPKNITQALKETPNTTVRNDPNQAPNTCSNASQKTLNISINVNTWKPQPFQAPEQHKGGQKQVAVEGTEQDKVKLNTQVIKGAMLDSAPKKDEVARRDDPNIIQKTLPSSHGAYSGVRPADDADSRTLFVSNVHFAATKDTLSRHFNKFGDVLKVIIVTDATTGQPTGSAYVEFLRKESAEHALSLNGTSFMSRILKVVMRSVAHHEVTSMMSWPRIARSVYPARLGRIPYPRGLMTANLRVRLPVKPGPRSLQWKRDNPSATNGDSTPGSATVSPGGRNLTYIRPGPKTDGSMGLA